MLASRQQTFICIHKTNNAVDYLLIVAELCDMVTF